MEKKINIAPFVVGDEVVCVETSRSGFLKVGKKYTITNISKICSCGFKVNVDNISDYLVSGRKQSQGDIGLCLSCGDLIVSNGLAMYKHSRFRKVKTQQAPSISFESIKESETKKESQEQEILIPN